MALLGRMFNETPATPARPAAGGPAPASNPGTLSEVDAGSSSRYQELKSKVHNQLFEYLDLSRIGEVSEERVANDVLALTRRILAEEKALLTQEERSRIVDEIQHEVFGLGPLEPLLADPAITDIMVNRFDRIYVERRGKLERT